MHLPSRGKHIVAIMLFSFSMIVVFSGAVKAERMSSSNYVIQADAMGIAGGSSTSTNYWVIDTLGEVATGENLQSTNYRGCAGFECFQEEPYISFVVRQGTSAPGSSGAGVNLGVLSPSTVKTSDGATVNSIFLTVESNAAHGVIASVRSQNAGLQRTSNALANIPSSTVALVPGVEGYGVCVFSAAEDGLSPTVFVENAPYDGTCTTTTGHDVGIVDETPRAILSSAGQLKGGESEILVKASAGIWTEAGDDYVDTLTFILSATY